VIAQGAQESKLNLTLAGYVRPRENQNADTLNLAQMGERMLSDLRRLVRSDPTFGGRATTRIAESKIKGGGSNDGSFDDIGAFVTQPIQLIVYWTDPDDIDTAIEAVVRACKSIKKGVTPAGASRPYHFSVKYVSRRMTDPDELPSVQVPAVWVVRDLGSTEDVVFAEAAFPAAA
jgi:hypothetical protein